MNPELTIEQREMLAFLALQEECQKSGLDWKAGKDGGFFWVTIGDVWNGTSKTFGDAAFAAMRAAGIIR